ncbi:hypothetical protein SDC9_105803 [bioreactor metagenome]|uniref:Uncharacterized protein n=1 Tax=bioreactor metagenome TaxID=1076179 RepID=A0A645B1P4_9ZZZZ
MGTSEPHEVYDKVAEEVLADECTALKIIAVENEQNSAKTSGVLTERALYLPPAQNKTALM